MGIPHYPSEPSPRLLWRADRKFVPGEIYGEDYDLDSTDYDIGEDFTYVPCAGSSRCPGCGRFARHLDEIIVAIDGACKGNGRTNPQAATIGVYFSATSLYNQTEVLNDPLPTNQKAELTACLRALETLPDIQIGDLNKVVIQSDSEYVVKGMTEWIFKWKKNGYKTSKGSTVANAELYKAIEQEIHQLNALDVEVLFWHVPRSRNEEADALANTTCT